MHKEFNKSYFPHASFAMKCNEVFNLHVYHRCKSTLAKPPTPHVTLPIKKYSSLYFVKYLPYDKTLNKINSNTSTPIQDDVPTFA